MILQLLGVLFIYTQTVLVSGLPQGVERVIAGSKASQGEYPYAAALSFSDGESEYNCSGAIISKRCIVTAGHCTFNSVSGKAIVGASDVTGSLQPGTQVVQFDEIKTHPNYTEEDVTSDVGLVLTIENIEFNDFVQQIALPNCIASPLAAFTTVKYVGFGFAIYVLVLGGTGLGVLRSGTGFTQDPLTCKLTGSTSGDTLCVSSVGQAPCYGDSGGPLTALINGVLTIVGVTSHGLITCGTQPNYFASLIFYSQWVHDNAGLQCPA